MDNLPKIYELHRDRSMIFFSGIFIGIRRIIGALISFFGGWLHGQNYWLGGHVYKLQVG